VGLYPGQGYAESEVALGDADLLFFYTDGMVETENERGDMFSIDRLEALLVAEHQAGVDDLLDRLERVVREFRGTAEPFDDATMMALRLDRGPALSSPQAPWNRRSGFTTRTGPVREAVKPVPERSGCTG